MRFHPATQILALCLLIGALQFLAPEFLVAFSVLILTGTFFMHGHRLVLLIRRTRWIMVSLVLIYAISTPGQPLLDLPGIFAPTYEGLADGVLQLMRLLAALAALAILLEHLSRKQLIAGLYMLFAPFQWVGGSRERLAVRLALTLHYAEAVMLRGTANWQESLQRLFDAHEEPIKQMEISLYRFGFIDFALLFASMIIIWLVL